jgi:two-component system NtrC family sensor kinase
MNHENQKNLVLIVDDEPQQRKMLSAIAAELGHNADSAADADECLKKIPLITPDVILVDVFLAGSSGIELCSRLKSDENTRHIPVICITGSDSKEIRLKCLDAGANDFISKPIDPHELMVKMRNLIQLKYFEDCKIENKLLSKTFNLVERAKREWEESMDCINDVVIVVNTPGFIIRCNRMLQTLTNLPVNKLVGRKWQQALLDGGFPANTEFGESTEVFHESGKWFECSLYSIDNNFNPLAPSTVVMLNDITESKRITQELLASQQMLKTKNRELDEANRDIKAKQSQLLQQEKMASIGQLAAGIAHEINNPMSFILGNINALKAYTQKIRGYITAQSDMIQELNKKCGSQDKQDSLQKLNTDLKLDFILSDLDNLIRESLEGADRIKRIVQDLKTFSRTDETEFNMADINAGIESTLNIAWNELKYKATVAKEYGVIPATKCYAGQLNQVFLNLLVNAANAIETTGEIRIKTWANAGRIYVSISDNGCGIPVEIQTKIFEPFFTTKEVGKGPGLGLSIAYDIIRMHKGDIKVESAPGKGTTFTISIPIVKS